VSSMSWHDDRARTRWAGRGLGPGAPILTRKDSKWSKYGRESSSITQDLGTRDWGLETCRLCTAGYYLRIDNNSIIHISHKIKHPPILQNEAVNPFGINKSYPFRAILIAKRGKSPKDSRYLVENKGPKM
jgi:hypothetical protein